MSVDTDSRNVWAVYQLPFSDVVVQFKTDLRLGLSETEAQKRLALYGRNELASDELVPV